MLRIQYVLSQVCCLPSPELFSILVNDTQNHALVIAPNVSSCSTLTYHGFMIRPGLPPLTLRTPKLLLTLPLCSLHLEGSFALPHLCSEACPPGESLLVLQDQLKLRL